MSSLIVCFVSPVVSPVRACAPYEVITRWIAIAMIMSGMIAVMETMLQGSYTFVKSYGKLFCDISHPCHP